MIYMRSKSYFIITKVKKGQMTAPFAVIFDMDGVIVDNMPYHRKAWTKFFEKYNIMA